MLVLAGGEEAWLLPFPPVPPGPGECQGQPLPPPRRAVEGRGAVGVAAPARARRPDRECHLVDGVLTAEEHVVEVLWSLGRKVRVNQAEPLQAPDLRVARERRQACRHL